MKPYNNRRGRSYFTGIGPHTGHALQLRADFLRNRQSQYSSDRHAAVNNRNKPDDTLFIIVIVSFAAFVLFLIWSYQTNVALYNSNVSSTRVHAVDATKESTVDSPYSRAFLWVFVLLIILLVCLLMRKRIIRSFKSISRYVLNRNIPNINYISVELGDAGWTRFEYTSKGNAKNIVEYNPALNQFRKYIPINTDYVFEEGELTKLMGELGIGPKLTKIEHVDVESIKNKIYNPKYLRITTESAGTALSVFNSKDKIKPGSEIDKQLKYIRERIPIEWFFDELEKLIKRAAENNILLRDVHLGNITIDGWKNDKFENPTLKLIDFDPRFTDHLDDANLDIYALKNDGTKTKMKTNEMTQKERDETILHSGLIKNIEVVLKRAMNIFKTDGTTLEKTKENLYTKWLEKGIHPIDYASTKIDITRALGRTKYTRVFRLYNDAKIREKDDDLLKKVIDGTARY